MNTSSDGEMRLWGNVDDVVLQYVYELRAIIYDNPRVWRPAHVFTQLSTAGRPSPITEYSELRNI